MAPVKTTNKDEYKQSDENTASIQNQVKDLDTTDSEPHGGGGVVGNGTTVDGGLDGLAKPAGVDSGG